VFECPRERRWIMPGVSLVGRPKKGTPRKIDPKGKTIGVRASAEYVMWLEQLARHNRSSISVLFDQALAGYAKEIGFPDPPPER
jgi:hypothetical protein